MMRCPSCGSVVGEDARFCASCGHPLGRTNEQRRIVTVLFADLVGFTGLAERMDPEQVKRLIELCFTELTADIEAFGGRVDKLLGDGILALFGAPISHEDDAERAVRCALKMHTTLTRTLAASPLGADHEGLQMRVGVNTGEVLVGTLGNDYTAMGDVVNLAARLQAMAPPGGVLVGDPTHTATAHAIEFEPAGMLQPRGREQGLVAWLARRVTALPGVRRNQTRVPLVGRDREVALGTALFELTVSHHRGALVAIVAEDGLGKTRVMEEFSDHLERAHRGVVLRGSCVPYGESNHWWPIATAIAQGLGNVALEDADAVRAAAARVLATMPAPSDPATFDLSVEAIAHLAGHPSRIDQLDPATAKTAIHQSVARALLAIGNGRPMLLAIDDLHWASGPLLDLVSYIVGILGRMWMIVMTTHRPDARFAWPPAVEHAVALTLYLDPLEADAATELARSLLGHDSADRLAEAIFERSGGNPLFIQEMAALTASGEGTDVLPDTLRSLIGARLDQLPGGLRQTLEDAATLGLSGSVSGLAQYSRALGHPYSYGNLLQLTEGGLLEVADGRWRFRSNSVRDATYQTMTKAVRARRHAGLAAAMAGLTPLPVDDLTFHTAAAAELVSELGSVDGIDAAIIDRAIDLLAASARRALSQGTLRGAVQHATRALGLISGQRGTREQRNRLLLLRANAAAELHLHAAAHNDLDFVLADLAEAATHGDHDPVTEAEALRILGELHHAEGHQDRAREALRRSVELLRAADDPTRLAHALQSSGYIELFNGSLSQAERFFAEADEIYTAVGNDAGRAWIEQNRALRAFLAGDRPTARERLGAIVTKMEALGDRNGVAWANGLLAFVAFYDRDLDEARRLSQLVHASAVDRSDDWAEAMMLTLQANLDVWVGSLRAGLDTAERALSELRRLGDPLGTVQAASVLLRAQVARGMFDGAQQTSQELLSLAETSPLGTVALVATATAALHRGHATSALSLARRAAERMQAADMASLDPTLLQVVALVQSARTEAALTLLATLPSDEVRQTGLAGALGAALEGHPNATHRALEISSYEGTFYFDRIVCDLIVAATARRDDPQVSSAALGRARTRAADTGDVIARSLVAEMARRLDRDVIERPIDDWEPPSDLSPGWLNVIDALTSPGRPAVAHR